MGVFDIDQIRAQQVARSLNVPWFHRLEDLLNQVEAVSIAVPTIHHHTVAQYCLQQGIHVLLEKPITETVEQARQLVEVARRAGVVFQVGHLERFNPVLQTMADKVRHPQRIEAVRQAPFNSRGSDVDVLLDLMIHDIDIILNLHSSPIISIEASGSVAVTEKIDQGCARIYFADGCEAHLQASRIAERKKRRLEVCEDDLHLTMDYLEQTVIVHENGRNSTPSQILCFEKTDTLMQQIDHFLDCILSGKFPWVDGESGLRALQLADLIRKHIMLNQRTLNPVVLCK